MSVIIIIFYFFCWDRDVLLSQWVVNSSTSRHVHLHHRSPGAPLISRHRRRPKDRENQIRALWSKSIARPMVIWSARPSWKCPSYLTALASALWRTSTQGWRLETIAPRIDRRASLCLSIGIPPYSHIKFKSLESLPYVLALSIVFENILKNAGPST
jgi:hypothetical protein